MACVQACTPRNSAGVYDLPASRILTMRSSSLTPKSTRKGGIVSWRRSSGTAIPFSDASSLLQGLEVVHHLRSCVPGAFGFEPSSGLGDFRVAGRRRHVPQQVSAPISDFHRTGSRLHGPCLIVAQNNPRHRILPEREFTIYTDYTQFPRAHNLRTSRQTCRLAPRLAPTYRRQLNESARNLCMRA